MASVCGGALATMDADVRLKAPVANIAMGLIKEGTGFAVLPDILDDEDHQGDMDSKVAGTGRSIRIMDFGAVIQLLPGRDGLLHISQIANERVNAVTDYLKEGQTVKVKVLGFDDKGRVKLSMKALLADQAAVANEGAAPAADTPPA